MMKKVIFASITLACVISVAGCGKGDTDSSSNDYLVSTQESSGADSTVSTDTDSAAVLDAFPEHTCEWDSGNITVRATCTQPGEVTYICKVCNTIRTETLPVAEHNFVVHSFADSCGELASGIPICIDCGYMDEETTVENVPGHHYEIVYPWGFPTCEGSVSYLYVCSECGEEGGSGLSPEISHDYEETVLVEATCISDGIIEYVCKDCGHTKKESYSGLGEHTWVTSEMESVWSESAQDFVTEMVTHCSVCNITKEDTEE